MKDWLLNMSETLQRVIDYMEDCGYTSTYVLLGVTEDEVSLTLDEAKKMKTMFDRTRLEDEYQVVKTPKCYGG